MDGNIILKNRDGIKGKAFKRGWRTSRYTHSNTIVVRFKREFSIGTIAIAIMIFGGSVVHTQKI